MPPSSWAQLAPHPNQRGEELTCPRSRREDVQERPAPAPGPLRVWSHQGETGSQLGEETAGVWGQLLPVTVMPLGSGPWLGDGGMRWRAEACCSTPEPAGEGHTKEERHDRRPRLTGWRDLLGFPWIAVSAPLRNRVGPGPRGGERRTQRTQEKCRVGWGCWPAGQPGGGVEP